MYNQDFSESALVAVAGTTTIGTITGIPFGGVMNLEVDNDGPTNVTDAFTMQVRDHPEGAWYDYLSATNWNAVIANKLVLITGDPDGLAAGSQAHAVIHLHAAEGVKFIASAATGAVTVVCRGNIVAPGPS